MVGIVVDVAVVVAVLVRFFEKVLSSVSACSRSVGGCSCKLGCLGALGSSACLEALGTRLGMLSAFSFAEQF